MVLVAGLVFGAGASSTLSAHNDFSNPASQSSHAREAIDAATGAGPSAGELALVAAPLVWCQPARTASSRGEPRYEPLNRLVCVVLNLTVAEVGNDLGLVDDRSGDRLGGACVEDAALQ